MKRRKPVFKMISYGEYSTWDRSSREIPKVLDFTNTIPAEAGREFGYVLQISHGKGETLEFRIGHPPFKDENGNVVPPFTGTQFIRTNDYLFYLGDCIWEPVEDKAGTWELTTLHQGKVVAHKVFTIKNKND